MSQSVEAFVPSPRFLSDSPARQSSSTKSTPAHISRPGQPLPPHVFSPSPSQRLLSPIPPPPANLFSGNTSAFNVDPGIPFLATVGSSDAGNSDKGSINDNESPKRFVGGFVTGLKKALTIKGSRRRDSNYRKAEEELYSPPAMIRDSGYATSDRLEEPPADQPPLPLTTFAPSPPLSPQYLLPATSEPPPPNDYQTTNDYQIDPPAAPYEAPSLDSMASAVTAHVGYGPDYAKMDRPTPPQSDVSLNTYFVRIQNFVHGLAALPWIAKDRVTVDYYPAAAERRDKHLSHRPAIIWRSQDYNYADYQLDSDTESLTLKMTPHLHVRAPSHGSHVNLGSEFSGETSSSLPYHPPNTVQTPDHRRVQSEGVRSGLEGEVKFSSPNASKSPIPASSVQKRWADPFPNPTPMFVPNWGAPTQLPDTLPSFPPNTGQTLEMSQAYVGDPRFGLQVNGNPALLETPPARNTPNLTPLGSTPRATPYTSPLLLSNSGQTPRSERKPSFTQRGGPEPLSSLPLNTNRMRSHSTAYGEDPQLGSRNNASPAFSNTTPKRHRPASVQSSINDPSTTPKSGQRWESTPKPEYSASPQYVPETPSSNRRPRPVSPSRRSHKSPTSSRRPPHRENTEEWEPFPQDRPGYVPFEYSENYYGTQYGVGIHGLLPPVARVSSASSATPSIKQPQPQYPRPTLVTPPSRTSSIS